MYRILFAIALVLLQILSTGSLSGEVLVDNDAGAPGYVETGAWTQGTSPGYLGGTYRTCIAVPDTPTHTATWTPNLVETRTYGVYTAFRQSTNRSTSVPFIISHAGGETTVPANQNGPNTMVEIFLGEYKFEAGTSGSVRLENVAENGVLIADAVIWRIIPDPSPEITDIRRAPDLPGEIENTAITATITDNTAVTSASLQYRTLPGEITHSLILHDDGLHSDGEANDNRYGATIPAQAAATVVAWRIQAADDLGQLAKTPYYYYAQGPLSTSIPGVVVDNDDGAPGYTEAGSWTTSTSTGYRGGTYRYAFDTGSHPASHATWTAQLPRDGIYQLYAGFLAGSNRTSAAPITISHADGESIVFLDQTGSDIVEVYLGQFPFTAGGTAMVRMDNDGPTGVHIADAFIWRQQGDPPPRITQVTRDPVFPSAGQTILVTARISDNVAVACADLVYTVESPGTPYTVTLYDDGAHGDGLAGDDLYGATIPTQPDGSTVAFRIVASDDLGQTVESRPQRCIIGGTPRNVYIILSSDTSVWSIDNSVVWEKDVRFGRINWNVFDSRTGVLSKIFDPRLREQLVDSLGRPFKVTWFMHGGAWFRTGINSTHISATYHIRRNWGNDIEIWGDALEYHFHHYVWDGVSWEMAPTFAETIPEYEWVMSQMMIDEDLFITSFRSGWNYMDNSYQQYLERWVPFRMEGVQTGWVPYHPSFDDYRQPGTMKGWEVRHHYTGGFTTGVASAVFAAANAGTDQVVCIWSHQNEGDFPEQLAAVDTNLHAAHDIYPGVQFHYLSAREAMQQWLGTPGSTSPPLDLDTRISGTDVDVIIRTADDIYQEQPWVAARRHSGEYERLDTTWSSVGVWSFDYSTTIYDKVSVGVSDDYGNETLADVDDGSIRWCVQSEFARVSSTDVDFDTSPTCVMLARNGNVYTASGSITFDYEIPPATTWKSIALQGFAPPGTSLHFRYKTASSRAQLDNEPWTPYQSESTAFLDSVDFNRWIRLETLLTGTADITPGLNSLELSYTPPGTSGLFDTWMLY